LDAKRWIMDSRHHPVIDAIGLNTKLKSVFPVGSYISAIIQESTTGRQRCFCKKIEKRRKEEEEEDEEEKTYRGIPPKDLCFNLVMRY